MINKLIKKKSIIIIFIILLIISLYSAYSIFKPKPVHWHAWLNISVCGESKDLPRVPEFEHHLGTELLHTHDDNVIHIEGVIDKDTDISLGRFFDVISVKFNKSRIFDYNNGDKCSNNKKATLKMFVNGKRNYEFRDYNPKHEDLIRIIFD